MATADQFTRELPPDADLPWIKAKLMSKVVKQDDGCWRWTGYVNECGYGGIIIKGQKWVVTRLILVLHTGQPIPPKMYACHTCDNPSCLNPDHLFAGTMKDNIQDCLKKGRNFHKNTTHCPKGHELSGENVYISATPFGGTCRSCRKCDRAKNRRKAGWPEHMWYSDFLCPNGYKVDKAGNVVPVKRARQLETSDSGGGQHE